MVVFAHYSKESFQNIKGLYELPQDNSLKTEVGYPLVCN